MLIASVNSTKAIQERTFLRVRLAPAGSPWKRRERVRSVAAADAALDEERGGRWGEQRVYLSAAAIHVSHGAAAQSVSQDFLEYAAYARYAARGHGLNEAL
jgi:hypothetical protein